MDLNKFANLPKDIRSGIVHMSKVGTVRMRNKTLGHVLTMHPPKFTSGEVEIITDGIAHLNAFMIQNDLCKP